MGLSCKYFIYDEDNDSLQIVPSSRFEKLYNFDPSFSIKEYSGRMIKYIAVEVQLENRRPVSITDIKYHIMQLDRDGKYDRKFFKELNLDFSKLISIPILGKPENVIDKSTDFAEKRFKLKYSWSPPPNIENRIREIIFGR